MLFVIDCVVVFDVVLCCLMLFVSCVDVCCYVLFVVVGLVSLRLFGLCLIVVCFVLLMLFRLSVRIVVLLWFDVAFVMFCCRLFCVFDVVLVNLGWFVLCFDVVLVVCLLLFC